MFLQLVLQCEEPSGCGELSILLNLLGGFLNTGLFYRLRITSLDEGGEVVSTHDSGVVQLNLTQDEVLCNYY